MAAVITREPLTKEQERDLMEWFFAEHTGSEVKRLMAFMKMKLLISEEKVLTALRNSGGESPSEDRKTLSAIAGKRV